MEKIGVLILAAGLGKRLGGNLPKVLARTSEKELLGHVIDAVSPLNPERLVVVVGNQKEKVEAYVKAAYASHSHAIRFAVQPEQRGTGHAVQHAQDCFADFSGTILLLCGDAPLITTQSLQQLLRLHAEKHATLSVVAASLSNPASYGRVLRDQKSGLIRCVREAKDCTASELQINEIAQGSYAVDSAFLWPAVQDLKPNNAQKELYLTDIVAKAATEGQTVISFCCHDPHEALGVNDPLDLARVNAALNARRVEVLLRSGVSIMDPASTWVSSESQIAAGSEIGPNVQILGKTIIASKVKIDGTAIISNCSISEGAHIKLGVTAEDAQIGTDASVGPFANLRPGTVLGAESKIGNFVETKKARLARGVKASHLTYLGDCEIGENSNIGAGTITCNYDGYQKSQTSIGRDVFIGSNSSLVAPVVVEDGATVGAGSVITQRVDKDALALTRAPQEMKPGWSKRKRDVMKKKGA